MIVRPTATLPRDSALLIRTGQTGVEGVSASVSLFLLREATRRYRRYFRVAPSDVVATG